MVGKTIQFNATGDWSAEGRLADTANFNMDATGGAGGMLRSLRLGLA